MKLAFALGRRACPTPMVRLVGVVLAWGLGSGPALGLDPSFVGVNAGAPISGNTILFTDALAADIAASGCRFVRINFIGAASGWDATRLGLYDQIIANARNHDLDVLAIFSNETVWGFSQAQWNENYNTTGLNNYVTTYAQTAYLLINRYKDDVKLYEIWNEPSCWSVDPNGNPLNAGCTYIWPRIFANMLAETYKECIAQGGATFFSDNDVSLVSGGLFAHDIGGTNPASATAYAHDMYSQADIWTAFASDPLNPTGRQYPWDFFGYHFYLNQGSAVSTSELNTYFNQNASGHVNDGIRREQLNHNDTTPILLTEFGWHAPTGVSLQMQAENLRDTYNWLRTQDSVQSAMWYQWNNGDPNGDWGLVFSIGNPKPAYFEFAAQTGILMPPIADFQGAPLAGSVPLTVNFAETAVGVIDTFHWDFGDGDTSGLPNPSHTYTAEGSYTVALTATGPGGSDTMTKTDYVTVSVPPGFGDLDSNGTVDLKDFAIFATCFTGAGVTAIPAGCEGAGVSQTAPVATYELAGSLGALSSAISASDLLHLNSGVKEAGGFHGATPGGDAGGLADLTDGVVGINVEAVLADFSRPSLQVRYELSPPRNIGTIRVFAANIDGRVFQNYDVAYSVSGDPSFQPLISGVVTGPFGQVNTGSIEASLTQVTGATPAPIALNVDALRFTFYAVSETTGVFRDQYDPGEPGDVDGQPQAIQASIIKEIDVFEFSGSVAVNIADLDNDGDVDLDDLEVFVPVLTGPNP